MKTVVLTAFIATSIGITGCNGMSNEQVGSTTGAVIGGAIGKQFGKGDGKHAATIAGTIAGSLIGAQIGRQMDGTDYQNVNNALYTGRPTTWQNPSTGHSYQAVPGNAYQVPTQAGKTTTCRPVTVVGYINGQQQNVQMNACQGPNGVWQAM